MSVWVGSVSQDVRTSSRVIHTFAIKEYEVSATLLEEGTSGRGKEEREEETERIVAPPPCELSRNKTKVSLATSTKRYILYTICRREYRWRWWWWR